MILNCGKSYMNLLKNIVTILDFNYVNDYYIYVFGKLLIEFESKLKSIMKESNVKSKYIHILLFHVNPILKEHRNIKKFAKQGMENSNLIHKLLSERGVNYNYSLLEQFMCWYYRMIICMNENIQSLPFIFKRNSKISKKSRRIKQNFINDLNKFIEN